MRLFLFFLALLPSIRTFSTPNVLLPQDKLYLNSTLQSENRTFELAFFAPQNDVASNRHYYYYLGIRYASIPTPTYVWVANRESPLITTPDHNFPTLEISQTGKLVLKLNPINLTIWETPNTANATRLVLLETGNLVLLSPTGSPLWQSFDYPTDAWLPGMNLTSDKFLTSWKTSCDPSPGLYSLRLDPDRFNQFQLVYNGTVPYWSTGNWTGSAFASVPEMTIPYIYRFHFENPFSPSASFWYTETALDGYSKPPLTLFRVEVNGLFKQFTWTQQTGSWDVFWSRPDDVCKVYGLCGGFGVCNGSNALWPCVCLQGFRPISEGDYTRGCGRESGGCGRGSDDEFVKVSGVGRFDGVQTGSFRACEKICLGNCSCVGFGYVEASGLCKILYGWLMNLRVLDGDDYGEFWYVRVGKGGGREKGVLRSLVLVGPIIALVVVLLMGVVGILVVLKRRRKGKGGVGEVGGGVFPVLNLKVFSYKELHTATKGFSEKLGHGGFGTVFLGKLLDSTPVAVKRLERPGNGEKEFRAEVRTIGNIQHVNLVRLRGFCSENSHRLLVYDYMPNGPLSAYLRQDGPNLSWDVRFRVAIGTARGIAYLHEGCRDCIIHCDIKPENILLDDDYMAKVSDFGLAKLLGRDFSRVRATMRGTWGYVAPEWISGVAITAKADVYSYGMTLLELLGGRRNVEAPPSAGGANGGMEVEKGEKWFFPPYAAQQIIEGNVAAVVDDRLEGAYNKEEAVRVALVAIWCIQDDEDARPAMGTVVKMLEGLVEVTTPPQPKLLQALISGESYRGLQSDSGGTLSPPGHCSGDVEGVSNCNLESSPGYASSPVDWNRNV